MAPSLTRDDGASVYLKLESELPTGSFKVRGALYALHAEIARRPVAEVVASSTGNHGAAVAEYEPCFQFARRDRAKPSGVRGPVLAPPCIRQRPLDIPGARHSLPRRVLAPHLEALFGSPGRLPFFSHPLFDLE